MKTFPNAHLASGQILLPNAQADLSKWAVIACDQFTSDAAYWQKVQALVGDAPSALKLTLPEIYLDQADKRTPCINACMQQYLQKGMFAEPIDGFVLVIRQTSTGKRVGLLAALDLEAYDYHAQAQAPVRATEGTILSRIPPRVAIRRDAPIELPHVMVLFDDPDNSVFGPLCEKCTESAPLYDFDLMLGGGHVQGYAITEQAQLQSICDRFAALAAAQVQLQKYGEQAQQHPLLFAVGDGNHSLATAKAVWEEKKAAGASIEDPARYALVELVNLYDPSLVFEPIHRLLIGVDAKKLAQAFEAWLGSQQGCGGAQSFTFVSGDMRLQFSTANAVQSLPVGTLQQFLDGYLAQNPEIGIDYIHDDDALLALAAQPGHAGFLLPPVTKDAFFKGVVTLGALPRKTFSMGVSRDKRYYLESRKIIL